MNTRFSMKLGAVVVALFMNGLILGGTVYVVHAQSDPSSNEPVACTSKKAVQLHV